ncbi:unnamed protein product [Ambrosiozyma monospora]|uniref:Unnamed protein product n=1 Tax=Ambrosiozyma monospora TaxID=43982 RepID=A0ACB5SUV2_AMBMO|nr:unnamed protein product [Ambrosiozyma monospora]
MESFNILQQWLNGDKKIGIPKAEISPSIEIIDDPVTGRSLFATSSIQRHEKIITIPHTFLLNFITIIKHLEAWNPGLKGHGLNYGQIYVPRYSKQDEDPAGVSQIYRSFKLDEILSLSSFQLVSLYLVLEKERGRLSFWSPFINVLPDYNDLRFMPFTWLVKNTNSTIFPLLPDSIQKHCQEQLQGFNKDYKVVSDLIHRHTLPTTSPSLKTLSKDDFLWAWLCCNSRCLYMQLPKKLNKTIDDNFTLVPYVDFLNHHVDDHCGIEITNHQGFLVNTQEASYHTNDQIYFSYGGHSDEFLLCEYGFMFDLGINKYNTLNLTDYIVELMSPIQIEFLKNEGYFDDYTCNENELSFRTEIALACVQEKPIEFAEGGCPRSLRLFIDGFTDAIAWSQTS